MGSFKDVVGHRDVIQYLQNAVAAVSYTHLRNGSWNDKLWRTRENVAVYEEFCRWKKSFSSRFQ